MRLPSDVSQSAVPAGSRTHPDMKTGCNRGIVFPARVSSSADVERRQPYGAIEKTPSMGTQALPPPVAQRFTSAPALQAGDRGSTLRGRFSGPVLDGLRGGLISRYTWIIPMGSEWRGAGRFNAAACRAVGRQTALQVHVLVALREECVD